MFARNPRTPRTARAWFQTRTLPSHALLMVIALLIVYPVLWMVLASFKAPGELASNPWGWPQAPLWHNYAEAWDRATLGRALLNSVLMSLSTVLFVTVLGAIAGYAFAKFRFRFATPLFLMFVLTMQAPVPVIPLYVMLSKLGLNNSLLGLVLTLSAGGLPLAIFLFHAFFQSVPPELEEAAVLDGCTRFEAFWRVIIPISGPVLATVTILQFLSAWNDYFLSLVLLHSPETHTLPLAIQVFFYAYRTEWGPIFAALTIGVVPMIVLYVLMQRQFISGLTAGAVKG